MRTTKVTTQMVPITAGAESCLARDFGDGVGDVPGAGDVPGLGEAPGVGDVPGTGDVPAGVGEAPLDPVQDGLLNGPPLPARQITSSPIMLYDPQQ